MGAVFIVRKKNCEAKKIQVLRKGGKAAYALNRYIHLCSHYHCPYYNHPIELLRAAKFPTEWLE